MGLGRLNPGCRPNPCEPCADVSECNTVDWSLPWYVRLATLTSSRSFFHSLYEDEFPEYEPTLRGIYSFGVLTPLPTGDPSPPSWLLGVPLYLASGDWYEVTETCDNETVVSGEITAVVRNASVITSDYTDTVYSDYGSGSRQLITADTAVGPTTLRIRLAYNTGNPCYVYKKVELAIDHTLENLSDSTLIPVGSDLDYIYYPTLEGSAIESTQGKLIEMINTMFFYRVYRPGAPTQEVGIWPQSSFIGWSDTTAGLILINTQQLIRHHATYSIRQDASFDREPYRITNINRFVVTTPSPLAQPMTAFCEWSYYQNAGGASNDWTVEASDLQFSSNVVNGLGESIIFTAPTAPRATVVPSKFSMRNDGAVDVTVEVGWWRVNQPISIDLVFVSAFSGTIPAGETLRFDGTNWELFP